MRIDLKAQSPELLAKVIDLACCELARLSDPEAECREAKDWRDDLFAEASMELERQRTLPPGDQLKVLGFNLVADSSIPDGEIHARYDDPAVLDAALCEAPAEVIDELARRATVEITRRAVDALQVRTAPLRFGGYTIATGEGMVSWLARELPGAMRAEIVEWCLGQLGSETLDDDAIYRFEIDKLEADPSPPTVEYLRRYCTLRPEPAG